MIETSGPSVTPRQRHQRVPVAALLLAILGCEDPPSVPLYPANGTITVDGKPTEGVELRFYEVNSIKNLDAPRPFARSDAAGKFTLGTFKPADGAPKGTYKVTLSLIDPAEAGSSNPTNLLDNDYALPSKTTLEASIKEGENTVGPFEVKANTRAKPQRSRAVSPSKNGID